MTTHLAYRVSGTTASGETISFETMRWKEPLLSWEVARCKEIFEAEIWGITWGDPCPVEIESKSHGT